MRRYCLLLALALGGCKTFFVPLYSDDIHSQLASASEDLQRIQVLLQDTQHHGAADLEPVFVDTLTHLGEADAAAQARAEASSNFAKKSAGIISANIGRCEDVVKGAMQASNNGTLDAGAFQRMLVAETCDFPRTEEELLGK